MSSIVELLNEKKLLLNQLDSMFYGSIEVSEKDNKKYIYVHFRQNGPDMAIIN